MGDLMEASLAETSRVSDMAVEIVGECGRTGITGVGIL
jgi:hypothetical protein